MSESEFLSPEKQEQILVGALRQYSLKTAMKAPVCRELPRALACRRARSTTISPARRKCSPPGWCWNVPRALTSSMCSRITPSRRRTGEITVVTAADRRADAEGHDLRRWASPSIAWRCPSRKNSPSYHAHSMTRAPRGRPNTWLPGSQAQTEGRAPRSSPDPGIRRPAILRALSDAARHPAQLWHAGRTSMRPPSSAWWTAPWRCSFATMESRDDPLARHPGPHRSRAGRRPQRAGSTCCAFPSVSAQPVACRRLRRPRPQWLQRRIGRRSGFTAQVLPTSGLPPGRCWPTIDWHCARSNAAALLRALRRAARRTAGTLWHSPPFDPALSDGPHGKRVTARGAVDDKGQVMMWLEALRAWHAVAGGPPMPVTVLIEGEEEVGSVNLEPFLTEHRDALAADIAIISDTGHVGHRHPGHHHQPARHGVCRTDPARRPAGFALRVVRGLGAQSDQCADPHPRRRCMTRTAGFRCRASMTASPSPRRTRGSRRLAER